MKPVTITCISDTHMSHEECDIPTGDILLHAGDFGSWGTFQELATFNQWLGTLDYETIINCAGNHDKVTQDMGYQTTKQLFSNSVYLQDDSYTTPSGLKVYGAPWSKKFGHWSWMKLDEELDKEWAKIPDGTDILLIHGPPYGILDKVKRRNGTIENTGSVSLRKHIFERLGPAGLKAVVFGHIHCDRGETTVDGIKFINAAMLDDDYILQYKPIQFVL